MQTWRNEDHAALEAILTLGGWRTSPEVAQALQTDAAAAGLALLRLLWRGVVEYDTGMRWRVRPEVLEAHATER